MHETRAEYLQQIVCDKRLIAVLDDGRGIADALYKDRRFRRFVNGLSRSEQGCSVIQTEWGGMQCRFFL